MAGCRGDGWGGRGTRAAEAIAASFVAVALSGLAIAPVLRPGYRTVVLAPLAVVGLVVSGVLLRAGRRLGDWLAVACFAYAAAVLVVASALGAPDGVFLPFFSWLAAYGAWTFRGRAFAAYVVAVSAAMAASVVLSLPEGARLARFVPEAATLLLLTVVVSRLRVDVEETHRRTEAEARIDALTGVLNRGSFERALDAEVAVSGALGRPLSLLIGDVDRFKEVNDTLGHPTGDRVLAGVAQALRTGLRSGDDVFRLGGDEFAVLLPGAGISEARALAEELRLAAGAVEVEGVRVSMSFGAASSEGGPPDRDRLYVAADRALYVAKAARARLVSRTPERGVPSVRSRSGPH